MFFIILSLPQMGVFQLVYLHISTLSPVFINILWVFMGGILCFSSKREYWGSTGNCILPLYFSCTLSVISNQLKFLKSISCWALTMYGLLPLTAGMQSILCVYGYPEFQSTADQKYLKILQKSLQKLEFGLPSMGLHRVGHDWSDAAAVAAATV